MQAGTATRYRCDQILARPFKYRHEIVAHGCDTLACKVLKRCTVSVKVCRHRAGAAFDVLMHRQAFDYIPSKARSFDLCPAVGDCLFRPDLTVRNGVQGADNASGTGLRDLGECQRVKFPEPAPSFALSYTSLSDKVAGSFVTSAPRSTTTARDMAQP